MDLGAITQNTNTRHKPTKSTTNKEEGVPEGGGRGERLKRGGAGSKKEREERMNSEF